ncbi:hypothetical protein [Leptolyngbya iicbica]|uniref:Uncharacterized protein n=2 Tax=Cyanophyceae TaxID=3028117 RepID=A0A4Q7E8K7_9CYAN|nr:hypothetical protein [Leptolyngbya sp. LK]RZM78851.1 hypothetical protein DYY88_08655 [Leptolyngbya sp. LK]
MSDLLWQQSAIAAALQDHQLACGVVLHPVTHNWQTWFSLYGTDITCIFASKNYELARAVQQMFLAKLRAGELMDSDRAKAFISGLQHYEESELIDPLPQHSIEGVLKALAGQISCPAPDHDADQSEVDEGF